MDTDAALGVQQPVNAPVDLIRCRDRRIAQAEVVDLVLTEKFCLLPAVFENLPDLIGSRSHFICLSVEHAVSFFLSDLEGFSCRFCLPGSLSFFCLSGSGVCCPVFPGDAPL